MSLTVELKQQMKCCLSQDGHVVNEPILITLCDGYACRSCRDSLISETVRCSNCKMEHKIKDLKEMKVNERMKHLIEAVYIKELIEELRVEINEIKDKNTEESLITCLEERIKFIENEIEMQVASVEIELQKYRDEMINELHQLKDCFLRSTILENIKKASAAQTCDHQNSSLDHKYFQELQNRMKTMQKEINMFKENINEINFTGAEMAFEGNIIGMISRPKYKIKSCIKKGNFGAVEIQRGCYSKLNNRIVLIDNKGDNLKILDCDGNYLDSFKHKSIKRPEAVYIDKTGKIYLYDDEQDGVLVFDINMKFLLKIDCPEISNSANYLEMDEDHKDKLLYVSDGIGDIIAVYNGNNGHIVKSLDIDSPTCMQFHKTKFYITSGANWETNSDGKYDKIEKGSNCIFVLHRVNHNLLHKFQYPNLMSPIRIHVNEDGSNLFAIAFHKNGDEHISEFLHLFVFDRNYNLIQNLELEAINLRDILLCEKKILFSYSNSIEIREIDNRIE